MKRHYLLILSPHKIGRRQVIRMNHRDLFSLLIILRLHHNRDLCAAWRNRRQGDPLRVHSLRDLMPVPRVLSLR